MSVCGEGSWLKEDRATFTVGTLRCRSWGCDHCAPVRRGLLIKQARKGRPIAMATFTLPPLPGETPDEMARRLSWMCSRWWEALRKKFPMRQYETLRVFEAHKSGYPHLHVLWRGLAIDLDWCNDTWVRLGGASNGVKLEWLRSKRDAAAYVAKYIGKAPHRYPGTQRYRASRGYELGKQAPDPSPIKSVGYVRPHHDVWLCAEVHENIGCRIEWTGHERYTAWKPGTDPPFP